MFLCLGLRRPPRRMFKGWRKMEWGAPSKDVSYAKVVNKGKREVGEAIWTDGKMEEVLKNLEHFMKFLVGR